MESLNKIAESGCVRLGQPTNRLLRENIKFAVRSLLALYIRRDAERNAITNHYIQRYTTKLQFVDQADSCPVITGCKMLRTVDKVPTPIRLNNSFNFKYVGEADWSKAFTQVSSAEVPFTRYNKFTGKETRFEWINGYIYIWDTTGINPKYKFLGVQAAHENPAEATDYCVASPQCFTDDDPFIAPGDMIYSILDVIVKGEVDLKNSYTTDDIKFNTTTTK